MPIAQSVARQVRRSLPYSIPPEDIEATGYLGLIKAVDTYDPDNPRRVPLKIWIRFTVRGAIIDAYRDRNYAWELHAPLVDDSHPAQSHPPDEAILRDQQSHLLSRAMRESLTRRERAALRRSLAGETLEKIGGRLGVSGRSVCEYRRRAISKVQVFLGTAVASEGGANARA